MEIKVKCMKCPRMVKIQVYWVPDQNNPPQVPVICPTCSGAPEAEDDDDDDDNRRPVRKGQGRRRKGNVDTS